MKEDSSTATREASPLENGEVQANQLELLLQSMQSLRRRTLECLKGKARCALETGEIQRGLQLAADINCPQTYRQCARILLRLQQHRHAATLLHKAGETERAAALYIKVTFFHARLRCKQAVALQFLPNIT